jgi:hypothetical protein
LIGGVELGRGEMGEGEEKGRGELGEGSGEGMRRRG